MAYSSGIVGVRGHSFYAGACSDQSSVVDLGAHLGQFSSTVARLFGCKVYAVEALPSLYAKIPPIPGVRVLNYAIAGRNGTIQLLVGSNPESNSIHKVSDGSCTGTVNVEAITFEDFLKAQAIDKIDLLKVDIEGAEVELFSTVSDDTLSRIKQISVEFHDFLEKPGSPEYAQSIANVQAITERLAGLGFSPIQFSIRDHTDVLFVNRKRCGVSLTRYLYWAYVLRYARAAVRFAKRAMTSANEIAAENPA